MIQCYSGMCGSGKSLHATSVCKTFLKRGDLVLTNYPLNVNNLKSKKTLYYFYISNNYLENPFILINIIKLFLQSYPKKRILIVIDEAHVLFDSRQWNNKNRTKWLEFFATHRHLNVRSDFDVINVIMVTQSIENLDKRIRSITEYQVKHLNISNYKTFGFLLGCVFGSVILYKKCWMNLKKDNVCETGLLIPLHSITNLYSTLEDFSG